MSYFCITEVADHEVAVVGIFLADIAFVFRFLIPLDLVIAMGLEILLLDFLYPLSPKGVSKCDGVEFLLTEGTSIRASDGPGVDAVEAKLMLATIYRR